MSSEAKLCAFCNGTGTMMMAPSTTSAGGPQPCRYCSSFAALPEAAIRAMPYDVNDDYMEVRRDERERIIAALAPLGGVVS